MQYYENPTCNFETLTSTDNSMVVRLTIIMPFKNTENSPPTPWPGQVNSGGAGPMSSEWMLPKALWLMQEEPEVFNKATYICEYQVLKERGLSGCACVAALSGCAQAVLSGCACVAVLSGCA